LRQQIYNLRRLFHKATITNWRMLNLMCWVIRGQPSHNLQSCLHRSGPHNLVKQSPHATEHLWLSSAIKNIYTQHVFTTWWTIYLRASKSPKRSLRSLTTMLTPKWSA
jgi:hypothetical protein